MGGPFVLCARRAEEGCCQGARALISQAAISLAASNKIPPTQILVISIICLGGIIYFIKFSTPGQFKFFLSAT